MGKKPNGWRPAKSEGANRKALEIALAGYRQPRVDTKDTQAIAERIDQYLQFCMEHDTAPGVAGCANWLGIGVRTLEDWYTGRRGSPEHQRAAASFYGVIQDVWQIDMHEGNVNPVAGIFVSKVFYGYKDTQEIVIRQDDKQELSNAELIAESKRLPGAERLALPEGTQTIDADYKVIDKPIENDPAYERAKERADRMAAQKAKPVKNREYMKKYYQEHKAEYKARKAKAAEKKRAERAQKG